jgi:hypothetical protein
MKKIVILSILFGLAACGGGGGADTKTVVKADTAPTNTATTTTTTDSSPTNIDVPTDFDFSNFQTVTLPFTIPNDLIGQVDYKIYGQWNNEVQDLIIGRGYGGLEKSIQINIPSTLTSVTVDYLAFDKASGNYEVRSEEISL